MALALTSLAWSPGTATAKVPAFVRHHEAAIAEIRSPRAGDTAPRVTIHALGMDMVLELVPSPAFSEDFVVREVGKDGTIETAGGVRAWQGNVSGQPGSRVALAMVDGALDGFVAVEGQTIFIEPARRWYKSANRDDIIAYRASDVDAASLDISCGADPDSTATLQTTPDAGLSSPRLASGTTLGLLPIAMIADFEMYQIHGGATSDYVSSILNQVSLIYQKDLSVLLQANSVTVYTTAADPFTSTSNPYDLLSEVGTVRATDGGAIHGAGLAHLYTGRDLSGKVVGLATVGKLCANASGVGLSQYFTTNNYLQMLLTAHEIGHNFGAYHDNKLEYCPDTPSHFIMSPNLDRVWYDEFSDCSLSYMESELAVASCVIDAISPDCGDGNLDPGEDCDDGNNLSGDCCALNCVFEPAGADCTDDADVCTDDVCDGAGFCSHLFNSAPCDDGDACTLEGSCSAGTCQASAIPTPLEAAVMKVKIKGGGEDKFAAKAKMYGALASPPAADGFTVVLTDGENPIYEGTVPAAQFTSRNGVRFEFHDNGQVLPREVNSLVRVTISYKARKGLLTVKAKAEGLELSAAASKASLGLRMEVGDTTIGDCGTSVIPCGGDRDLKCRI